METNLPWTAASLDALIGGATERVPVHSTDAKSGASFEKLIIDGRQCFLKLVSPEDDWITRVTGNTFWEFRVWQAGVYQRVPSVIDHAMIGMALDDSSGVSRLAMLMHDRSADLVPSGDDHIAVSQHAGFIQHLALMHAANVEGSRCTAVTSSKSAGSRSASMVQPRSAICSVIGTSSAASSGAIVAGAKNNVRRSSG